MARLDYHEKQIIRHTREAWAYAREQFRIPFFPHGIKVLMASDLFMATSDEETVAKYVCPAVAHAVLYTERGLHGAAVVYNRKAIKQNPRDMLNETVPHELAHVIQYAQGDHYAHHNNAWHEACVILGGTGQATYREGQYDMGLSRLHRLAYKLAKPFARRGTFQHVLEPSVI